MSWFTKKRFLIGNGFNGVGYREVVLLLYTFVALVLKLVKVIQISWVFIIAPISVYILFALVTYPGDEEMNKYEDDDGLPSEYD